MTVILSVSSMVEILGCRKRSERIVVSGRVKLEKERKKERKKEKEKEKEREREREGLRRFLF